MLLALAPLAARADEVMFRGQKIEYGGASEVKIWGEEGSGMEELVLVFTNADPTVEKYIKSPLHFSANVLAVGGGGGGGTMKNQNTYTLYGGGGGGGAGELIARDNVGFEGENKYVISVGVGGAGATVTTSAKSGTAGGPTAMTNATTGAEIFLVNGGGGGGGQATGKAGGSGGGGSYSSSAKAGGASEKHEADGMGNAGGQGKNFLYGAGGGGAGSEGGPGVTGTAGAGGDGIASGIALAKDAPKENWLYYAGGGGGGVNVGKKSSGTGGSGVGGNGGTYANEDAAAPTPGKDGTGSGGGGGQRYRAGAPGGCGTVIVRIIYIEIPIQWKEIPVTVGGKTGYVRIDDKANYKWDNGDLVITYTNVNFRGAMRVGDEDMPVWANARVLAVGGGGGGGFINVRDAGGGSGGGAGGFVEKSGLVFDNTTQYSVIVGKGGAGGKANEEMGENGSPSSLRNADGEDLVDEAMGGGGGGAHSEGAEGGSGGGGSEGTTQIAGTMARDGGVGHQGYNGGRGINPFRGAGGGGAGGQGADGENAVWAGGVGGKAKSCDITGETLWYAGGGGGAFQNANDVLNVKYPGGAGGGNDDGTIEIGGRGAGVDGGASTKELNPIPATSGMDGRGGGGGGGTSHANATTPAGNGGSGVVIIRLSGFVVKSIPLPVAHAPFTYNGREHRGVEEMFAYTLVGAVGTNANVYIATATIAPDAPYEWDDGGRGERKVPWVINPLKVDVPTVNENPRPNYFVFGNQTQTDEEEKLAINSITWRLAKDRPGYPGETCATTNEFSQLLPYCTLTGHREINANDYVFTAALVTTDPHGAPATNFVWRNSGPGRFVDGTGTGGPMARNVEVDWTILTAQNAITQLSLDDWQEGTTNKTPKSAWRWDAVMRKYPAKYPQVDIVKYQWKGEDDASYTPEEPVPLKDLVLPTEAGVYTLRAYICRDSNHLPGNWMSAEDTVRFCVWRHPSKTLADWVDITYTWKSGAYLPVSLYEPTRKSDGAISGGYPGFRYADIVGDGDLAEIRFVAISNIAESAVASCDATNVLARDELLAFKAETWSRNGTSKIRVKMPPNNRTPSKIRMYWRRRPGQSAILADKLASEVPETAGSASVNFTLVNQLQRVEDGLDVRAWVNYWTTEPVVTRYVALDALKSSDVYKGVLKSGTVDVTYRKMPEDRVVDFEYVRTNLGPYTVNFTLHELETGTTAYPGAHVYYDGDRTKDLEIYRERPQPIDPTGAGGMVNVRVLLGNDDVDGRGGNAVTNQAYDAWRHYDSLPPQTVVTNATKTVFEVMTNNLQNGTEHALTNAAGVVQWKLDWTYLGNMMTADTNDTAQLLLTGQHSLPWCATGAQRDRRRVGQMVMMNQSGRPDDLEDRTAGAVIRSPWYTNGFSTVYFDAVNAYTTNTAAFRLQVEVSTNAFDDAVTESQRSNVVWTLVRNLQVMKFNGSAFASPTKVTDGVITLAIGKEGSTGLDRFYRVIAPVPAEYVRTPCRFRIRRTSMLGEETQENADDWHGFIVVDNVIASWPTEVVSAGTRGWFDPRKAGKQVLGWETAFSVDYPTAAEPDLRVSALFRGDPSVVTSARCHYRWRYLDAEFDPPRTDMGGGKWQENYAVVYLDPNNGFRSIAPFAAGKGPGDIEYWFDLTAVAPYYSYCDYSGLTIPKPTGDYTENPEKGVTGRRPESEGRLPSRGTDWFVRLREGASGYESIRGHFRYTLRDEYGAERNGSSEVDLFLTEDHVWRGYFRTPREMAGGLARYRFTALTPSAPGSTHPQLSTNDWVASENLTRPEDIPGSPILRPAGADEWAEVYVDASTGFLMLQFDDRSKSLTVMHADYQDFNGWSDAVSHADPPLFTGSSIEGPKKSGSSSKTVRVAEAFDRWTDTPETKDWWQENFKGTIDDKDGKRPGYTPFTSVLTPEGWTANNGMWVARFYHPTDADSRTQSGLAAELFGAQNGNVQLLNPVGDPRGVGTVSFTARVAQAIDADAFALSQAEAPAKMTDYCFMTRATFDTEKNLKFAGNASLSLVACFSESYRTGYGFYEARWEQLKGSWDAASGTFMDGPNRKNQRLCLYRWMKGAGGELEPELLGAVTNTAFNIPQTDGLKGQYMPFFISAYTDPSTKRTTIAAGVNRTDGGMAATAAPSGNWMCFVYVDSKLDHPQAGSYGVLSANCEGVFLRPTIRLKHATVSKATTTSGTFQRLADNSVTFAGDETECRDDLLFGYWSLDGERMIDFHDSDTSYWGIQALTPKATLQLKLSARGADEWAVFGERSVVGFGTNLEPGKRDEFVVRDVYDRSIRLEAATSPLTDIVLTDARFTQWGGDTYGEGDTTGFAVGEPRYGYPSNIVFTSGIIEPNATPGFAHQVKLSAKRTKTGLPSSVRSPFFDGGYNADGTRRGQGLGMIAVTYANAQANVNLLVQIATNGLSRGSDVSAVTKSVSPSDWTTVTNFDFSTCTSVERLRGVRTAYIGLHGVTGLMRVVLDPALVASVQSNKVTDTERFGEIDITKVVCRDEPALEAADWWGWNVRTVDDERNSVGDYRRTYLPDGDVDAEGKGLPIALNSSVTEDVREEDTGDLVNHMPFVQTPTFTNNVVGEISFKARRYDNGESAQYAEVELYGAYSGQADDDRQWVPLKQFIVSNTTYEAYSFKGAGAYSAFRLAVTGVKDVLYPGVPRTYDPAVRVLVDEVAVFEAVNPEMGFRYVYPFRDGMEETTACTNVVDGDGTALEVAQPLQGESWTVQAEVLATKLPDELDLTEHPPRVIFHWYEGDAPWGYANWRGRAGAHSAELAPADDEKLVFRGSVTKARAAIVGAVSSRLPVTVQYSADVIYHTLSGLELTNSLVRNASTVWVRPSWYAPVDRNAGKPLVSAYTILDTIAPHRVWINEVNLWDGVDRAGSNLANTNQYVEIAVPVLQAIEGWRLDYISNNKVTNVLVNFTSARTGTGYAPPTKDLSKVPLAKINEYRTNDYVFIAVQSPATAEKKTWDAVPGAIDATWNKFNQGGSLLDAQQPIALRLVRPSNVVEQEIVLEGTNLYATGRFSGMFSATNWIAQIERTMPGGKSQFYYVGNEYGNASDQSLGVVRGTGAVSNDWSNLMVKTPGRVNEGQIVPFGYVLYPNGELMLLRAQIGPGGHILQTVGEEPETSDEVTLLIKRGGPGTNITYRVANWYETAFVSTNGVLMAETIGKRGTFTVTVGAGASNDVTVLAMAQPKSELREKYGLTPDNRYTPAVMNWLEGGVNYFNEPFAHPGEIHLAEFHTPITDTYVTNLDLTSMYWLDIDPTVSNWVLKAGIVASRHGGVHPVVTEMPGGGSVTNFRMGVHMEITNEMTGASYAPYILRGLQPGSTSADAVGNWTSATFKVTGDIQNGVEGRERWIPLRWFVFKPDASKPNRSASFADDFRATVDIWDPKDVSRAIYTKPWAEYPDALIFYRWALDGRSAPVTVETLRPESTFGD